VADTTFPRRGKTLELATPLAWTGIAPVMGVLRGEWAEPDLEVRAMLFLEGGDPFPRPRR